MAALARFLPLFLVVTCLVLQTLQVVYGQRDHGELTMLQMQKQEQEDAIESNYSGKKRKRSAKEPTIEEKGADDRLKKINIDDTDSLKDDRLVHHLPIEGIDYTQAEDNKNIVKLAQDSFIIIYSMRRQTPLFVAERLDGNALHEYRRAKEIRNLVNWPVRKDLEYFRPDPVLAQLKKKSSTLEAYAKVSSTYDRGHYAPAADSLVPIMQRNSFVLSNMAPQFPEHNRRAWLSWEGYTRKKAIEKGELLVITGTTELRIPKKLDDGTIVPSGWYKLLIWCESGQLQAEYVWTLHENKDAKNVETRWVSTEGGLANAGRQIKTEDKKSVGEIQEVVKKRTNIDFKLTKNGAKLCEGNKVSRGLDEIKKSFSNNFLVITDPNKKLRSGNTYGPQKSTYAELESIESVCKKLKEKLHQLARTGKVTLSTSDSANGGCPRTPAKKRVKSPSVERNILDLSEGSFSGGCKKTATEFTYIEEGDEEEINDEAMKISEIDYFAIEEDKPLTAIVSRGQTLQLLNLLPVPKKIELSAINVRLQKVVLNCAAKQIDIYSASLPGFKFIPRVFELKKVYFALRINYGKDKHVIAGITGKWMFGSLMLDMLARFDTKTTTLLLKGTPSKKGLTINLKKQLGRLTGKSIPIPLPSFSFTNIAGTGQFDLVKGGLATIVVSGSIGKSRVHAVFQKPLKAGKFTGAFAAEIGPIRLASIIRKTIRMDVSRVPFFGTLTIPRLGVTVASEYITSSLLPNVFCKEGLLQNTGVTIPKGLQVFFVLNLKGIKVPLKMSSYKTFLAFEVIGKGRMPIGTILSAIPGVNVRSLPLPPGIRDILKFQIDYFSLDTSSKQLVLDTKFPGTLRYFNSQLTIKNLAMKVIAVLKHPRKLDAEVDGEIKIGKQDYEITISRDPSTKKYILKASFKEIPISKIIHKFSAKILPRALQKALRKFIQFSIHNAKLMFPLGTKNLQLHLSGTPVIGGYKTVHMSAVIVRQGGRTKIIEGFQFGKVSLANLIYQLTRRNLKRIAILDQELETSLVISPVTLPGVRLHGSKLKHISIVKGVTIHARLQWPSNCARDKFCAVAQRLLGTNAKFSLQASIQSTKSFMLSAGVSNVKLGKGVIMQRAALQIQVGKQNSVGIEGTIHLSKYGITLTAGIRVGSRGVVLQGNMQGCWKKAFGAKWLTICNLHLLIAIQPTVTLVGALEIGGQVRIGNPSCTRHPLTALGYFGVDQLNTDNNFYYVELKNGVTMGTLLKAFCIRFRLPRPLADSGFPKGFLNSYSPIGKQLPKAGIIIAPGYRLKGTINILGLVAHADMTISLPKGMDMTVALSPLRIGGGILQMYASSTDRSRGPFLKVNIEIPKRKVDIHASGFVSVFGIQAEAMLRITNKQYEYMIKGKFLNLFQARLHITAKYGNIKQAGFRVRGYLRNDLFAFIRNKIKRGLRSASQNAKRAIDNAKRKVNSKKALFDNANKKLENVKHRIDKAKGAVDRAKRTFDHWQRKINHLCRPRHCGSRRICWRCRRGEHCRKVWRSRFCVPRFVKCCRNIRDHICHAFNKGCNSVRRAVSISFGVAKRALDKSKHIFNAAKGLLHGAQRVVAISKRSLDVANRFLDAMNRIHQAGIKATSALASFATGGTFDIREISFDVALSAAATGHFKVSVLASFFGRLKRFTLGINLRNLTSFIKAIGERMIHGIKKFIR